MRTISKTLVISILFLLLNASAFAQKRVSLKGNFQRLVDSFDAQGEFRISPNHKSIKGISLSGKINSIGRFRVNLNTEYMHGWDADESYILLQGRGQILSTNSENFPVSATLTRQNDRYKLELFLHTSSNQGTHKALVHRVKGYLDQNLNFYGGTLLRGGYLLSSGKTCPVDHKHSDQENDQILGQAIQPLATLRVIEMNIDTDQDWNGSSVATIVNGADSIYRSELSATFTVVKQTTGVTYTSDTGFEDDFSVKLLNELYNKEPGYSEDLRYLFSGKSSDDYVGVVADLGKTCRNKSLSVGLILNVNKSEDIISFAHEVGHNLNAQHDQNFSSGGYIMDGTGFTDKLEFSDFSKGEISTFISQFGSCLSTTEGDSGGGGGDDSDDDSSDGSSDGIDYLDVIKDFDGDGNKALVIYAVDTDGNDTSTTINIFKKKKKGESGKKFQSYLSNISLTDEGYEFSSVDNEKGKYKFCTTDGVICRKRKLKN